MRHLELFAGIGGFRQALELLTKDGVMSFQNIGFSEIDKNAVSTYKSCYMIFVFLFMTYSLCMTVSRSTYVSTNGPISFPFMTE